MIFIVMRHGVNDVHKLKCNFPRFFSHLDESIFFEWLHRISAIRRRELCGNAMTLYVTSQISQADLRDLIGVFIRYRLDATQLAQLVSDRNQGWFVDSKAYWYKDVFSKKTAS